MGVERYMERGGAREETGLVGWETEKQAQPLTSHPRGSAFLPSAGVWAAAWVARPPGRGGRSCNSNGEGPLGILGTAKTPSLCPSLKARLTMPSPLLGAENLPDGNPGHMLVPLLPTSFLPCAFRPHVLP